MFLVLRDKETETVLNPNAAGRADKFRMAPRWWSEAEHPIANTFVIQFLEDRDVTSLWMPLASVNKSLLAYSSFSRSRDSDKQHFQHLLLLTILYEMYSTYYASRHNRSTYAHLSIFSFHFIFHLSNPTSLPQDTIWVPFTRATTLS